MNHTMRGISAILLAGALFAANALSVAATDQSGRTQLYLPGGNNAAIKYLNEADTFFNFVNVIPGDILTQNIEIQNRRDETVTFYLHAADSSKENELLQQIGITITDKNNGRVLYKGNLTGNATSAYPSDMYANPAAQPNGISLGNFPANATAHIEAKIHVPVEIDNDYAGNISGVTWNVRAQIPDPDSSGSDSGGGTDNRDDQSHTIITDADIPKGDLTYIIAEIPLADLPKTGGSAPCLGVAAALLAVSAWALRKRNTGWRLFSP